MIPFKCDQSFIVITYKNYHNGRVCIDTTCRTVSSRSGFFFGVEDIKFIDFVDYCIGYEMAFIYLHNLNIIEL